MPIKISLLPDLGMVLSRPSGVVTADTARAAWRAFIDANDLSDGVDILVDHRAVEGYEINFSDMQQLATLLGGLVASGRRKGRVAHLAPRNLGFGMGRMFEMITTAQAPVDVSVFRDPVELAAWLSHPWPVIEAAIDG